MAVWLPLLNVGVQFWTSRAKPKIDTDNYLKGWIKISSFFDVV